MRMWAAMCVALLVATFANAGAGRDGNWYVFAASDTLFGQESISQVFRIEGCNGFGWHFAGQGADSVNCTVEGSIDGQNWFSLNAENNQNWASGYTRIAEQIILGDPGVGVTESGAAPARYARLTVKCNADTTDGNADPDTLTAVTFGITCGGLW